MINNVNKTVIDFGARAILDTFCTRRIYTIVVA
jgi:hypothetical protein